MKKFCVLLMALLVFMGLFGCTGDPDTHQEESSMAAEDVDLTLWTFPVGDWGNPLTVSNLLTGFHKEYPGVNITVEYLDYDTGDQRINEAAQEGNLPDLVLEGPERLVANWGERGWMADLTDLWQSEQAGEIYEPVREACQLGDGPYYEYPICITAHCMAINYDLFREAGALQYIDEETRTWTTDDFIQAVQALADYGQENAGIVYCKSQAGDQGTRALMTNLYGGRFTNEEHTAYTIDMPENRQALQLLYDLEGIVFRPDMTSADAIDSFCKGETAMCFCWNGSVEVLQTINNPNLDFDVFPMAFPTDQAAPKLQGGIWGFGVFDKVDEVRTEAAKTFIRYFTENDEHYAKAVQASSYWPAREMDGLYENDRLMEEYSVFLRYMGDFYQITPGWAEARTSWWQMLARIGEGQDVSEAVKDF